MGPMRPIGAINNPPGKANRIGNKADPKVVADVRVAPKVRIGNKTNKEKDMVSMDIKDHLLHIQ